MIIIPMPVLIDPDAQLGWRGWLSVLVAACIFGAALLWATSPEPVYYVDGQRVEAGDTVTCTDWLTQEEVVCTVDYVSCTGSVWLSDPQGETILEEAEDLTFIGRDD